MIDSGGTRNSCPRASWNTTRAIGTLTFSSTKRARENPVDSPKDLAYSAYSLERSAQFGNRLFLADEEYAQTDRQPGRQLEADGEETASPGARPTTGPPAHWTERASRVSRQTPLVVEPADGRVPVTAAVEEKRDHDLAYIDSWEYMSPWDRCITPGRPAGTFPGGYGNVYEIVQAPGVVAIVSEMIHETRIIPTNGPPHPNILSGARAEERAAAEAARKQK